MSKLGSFFISSFRQAQRLFHMLVGLVFLCFAFAGVSVSYAEWQYLKKTPESGPLRFALIAGFTVLLIVFGLYSFAKARSIR